MKTMIMKGKNVDEATDSALKVLGLSREQVDIRILSEGKGGMLGMFGGEDAEVEVVEKMEKTELARTFLQGILDRMGFVAIAKVAGEEEGRVLLEIKGDDMGRIIGKDGATLDSLQSLIATMVGRTLKDRVRVTIDAEGYRDRRKKAIERIVCEAVKDVERQGIEKILPPMSAADRRVVHMFVKTYPKLASYSVGDREGRRVIINLLEKTPKEMLSMGEGRSDAEGDKGA